MAKPRVFLSSTYYDLKHLRSSLDNFIESLGYEAILSEKGDIAYTPDAPLDESCYREVLNADVFVLIIGGRYGSEASGEEKRPTHEFYERYDSITKQEYNNAVSNDIPTYILIENSVYSEYQTYLRNKGRDDIQYVHVDSANIFSLIEDIVSQPRNNPIHTFERFSDIESWLREQWAGLFRELLHRLSSQRQMATLSSEVAELREMNRTLKRYLEVVMTKVSPDESDKLIQSEAERLEKAQISAKLQENDFVKYLTQLGFQLEDIYASIARATSFDDFPSTLRLASGLDDEIERMANTLQSFEPARQDLNEAREIVGLKKLSKKRPTKS